MKTQKSGMAPGRLVAISGLALVLVISSLPAQNLGDQLFAYWPLDEVQGTKTPDVVSGYDLQLNNLTAADLVDGIKGKAFSFTNARRTLLSRVHSAGENLPVNQHNSFTISMWTQVDGTGQNDLRVFSEGNTGDSDPLFNLGTHNAGADGTFDLFFRQSGWTVVSHIHTTQQPFDGQWHHIVFVQNEGERTVYIDGVADDLVIPAKPAGVWRVNDTTIGGILRASPSHWVTGLIDEVALWKRALTAAEVAQLNTNGVPTVSTNLLPLEIRAFAADFPTVVKGDQVVLRWDVTKDAKVSMDQGVGDVSSRTVVGIGSVAVTLNQATTFSLIATRGNQSVTSQVPVRVIEGVAPGWRLLENFESYAPGTLNGKASWKNPEGVVTVVDRGVNKVAGFVGGNDLAGLLLNSLTLKEGTNATLFFRIYGSVEDQASMVAVIVALTEKPIRFNGDFNQDVGPYLRFEKDDVSDVLSIAARNGVGGAYDFSPTTLSYGKAYNIWIDVKNDPVDTGDIFSVYLQEEGTAGRTLLFDQYVGDRNPAGTVELGVPGPDLTTVMLAAIGAQGTTNILLDDFYLSQGGFKDTVPVAAASFEIGSPPADIRIRTFGLGAGGASFTVTWSAKPGANYNVLKKGSLTDSWTTIATGVQAGGDSASFTDTNTSQAMAFYQVSQAP